MVSPLDKQLLKCVAKILESKSSLVKVGKYMFDNQFTALVGYTGFPTSLIIISEEIDYLESIGLLKRLKIKDNYIDSTHYGLTYEGKEALRDK